MKHFVRAVFLIVALAGAAAAQVPIAYYDFDVNGARGTAETTVETQATGQGFLTLDRTNITGGPSFGGAGTSGIYTGGVATGQATAGSNWNFADPGSGAPARFFLLTSMFMRLLLPTLLRPMKANSGCSGAGHWSRKADDLRKVACKGVGGCFF